jgi:hypothetical protein
VYLSEVIPQDHNAKHLSEIVDGDIIPQDHNAKYLNETISEVEADLRQAVKRNLELFLGNVEDMIKNENKSKEYDYVVAFQVHEVIVDRPAEIFSLDRVSKDRKATSKTISTVRCAGSRPIKYTMCCVRIRATLPGLM